MGHFLRLANDHGNTARKGLATLPKTKKGRLAGTLAQPRTKKDVAQGTARLAQMETMAPKGWPPDPAVVRDM
jgi:hypothetical protein